MQKEFLMFGRSTWARDAQVGARRASLLPVHAVRRPLQSVSNGSVDYSSLGGEDVEDLEDSTGDVYQDSADEEEKGGSETETQYQAACKIQVIFLHVYI